MVATDIFKISKRKRNKLGAEVRKDLADKPNAEVWLAFIASFFKAMDAQFNVTIYLFSFGFLSLAIGIFYPIVADNPWKFVLALPALLFVFWFASPPQKKK